MDNSGRNPELTARIASVRLFMEPPPHLSPEANYFTTGLPKGFIESADRELELDGELISYMKTVGMLEIKRIPQLQDSERKPFFSGQVKSTLWDVYYGSGWSGIRYNVLIEYNVHPGVRFDTAESRQAIFQEWHGCFVEATMEYMLKNNTAASEEVANHAMNAASGKIMVKYGISKNEMGDIIAEGYRSERKD